MFYRIVHVLLTLWLRIHLRRLFLRGLHNVPSNGPVMFAANHGNAFLDAVILGLTIKRPVWFLTRSDVFKKRWQRYLLNKLNMIPIYRIRDGIDSLENNKETFEICTRLMREGKALLIFSEGNGKPEHRLRPLKKGTARIAFQAASEIGWPENFQIIPLGINYVNHTNFRTEVMLGFGEGIFLNKFRSEFESNQPQALKALTHELFQGIRDEMIHIPERDQEPFAGIALALSRAEKIYPLFGFRFEEEGRLDHEQQVLSNFLERDSDELREKLSRFEKRSRELHIPMHMSPSVPGAARPKSMLAFLLLAFFPALAGMIFHALPMTAAFRLTGKVVRDPQFYSSVLLGTGFLFTLIWYVLWVVVLLVVKPVALLILIILPLAGYLTLLYPDAMQRQRMRNLKG
ncbi:MAG: 1-acyl-sn-glycerol-3-phosphate acyltransferase [Bacteroidia bacterium]